ncbi:MAG: hypothetical protein ABI091_17150, partial [Ferruginibacter sp.]
TSIANAWTFPTKPAPTVGHEPEREFLLCTSIIAKLSLALFVTTKRAFPDNNITIRISLPTVIGTTANYSPIRISLPTIITSTDNYCPIRISLPTIILCKR